MKPSPPTMLESNILFSILILRPAHSWKISQKIAPFLKGTWITWPSRKHYHWRKDVSVSSRRGKELCLHPLPHLRLCLD